MRTPFSLVLAARYLRSTRRDAFVTFLSWVAAAGIGLGVFALVLALGALAGFQRALKDEILRRTPMVEVTLEPQADAEGWMAHLVARPEVVAARAVVRGRGWVVEAGKAQAVEAIGFLAGRAPAALGGGAPPPAAKRAAPAATSGTAVGGAIVSQGLARRWGLETGDLLTIVSPRPTLTPLGPQPRMRSVPLVATYATGRTEHGERMGLPYAEALTLFGAGDRRIEVETADLDAALRLASALSTGAPAGATVRTWRDLNRPLFFALRLEKTVMFLAVSLVVLVAAFALVSALSLLVANKRGEIGTLGALGASPAVLRRGFVLLGVLIAGGGLGAGGAAGLLTATLLDRYRVIRLPDRVYFLDHVPFVVQPLDVAAIVGLTATLALGFSWIAARRATALDPVEAMRR